MMAFKYTVLGASKLVGGASSVPEDALGPLRSYEIELNGKARGVETEENLETETRPASSRAKVMLIIA